ncbi:MAG: AI-2E family transporter [Candidatus Spechtbacterales bacterium]|nr:AI-2E family transporter [Candidatus Spechtbacterales bacterium]
MDTSKTQFHFLAALLLMGFILLLFIYLPYIDAMLLGAVLGIVFYPLYKKLIKATGGKEVISALITVIVVFLVILAPIFFFGSQILQEATQVYETLREGGISSTLQAPIETLESIIGRFVPGISINLNELARAGAEFFIQNISAIFSGIASFLAVVFLGMLSFYYLLKDGKKLKDYFIRLSPLKDENDRMIISRLTSTVNSVVRGQLLIALIQGALTGLGFSIFGIPSPFLWGSIAFLAALIPSIGTALVLIPGILYLFITGNTFGALGLTMWGVLAVGLVDNLLGPRLMRGKEGIMHPLLILLSVLGGIRLFGVSGLLIGPLVLSFFIVVADVYMKNKKAT